MAACPCPACLPMSPGKPRRLPKTNLARKGCLRMPGRFLQKYNKTLLIIQPEDCYTAPHDDIHEWRVAHAMANSPDQNYFVQALIETHCETGPRLHIHWRWLFDFEK